MSTQADETGLGDHNSTSPDLLNHSGCMLAWLYELKKHGPWGLLLLYSIDASLPLGKLSKQFPCKVVTGEKEFQAVLAIR